MIFILLFVAFFGFIIYAGIAANRQLMQKRQGYVAQMDALATQMHGLYAQSRALDPGTIGRVDEAQAAVDAKLNQARSLLSAATKDRHFERIQRILAQVQAKLGNVQAGVGRAQARVDARVQRQTEAEQRRMGARQGRQEAAQMQKATQRVGRGSFAPPAQVTNAQTDWNTMPTNERGVCFFCSRPCLLRELTPVTVPIGGQAQRVLACPQDLTAIRAGNLPPIRAFDMNGQRVPWYAYGRYNPYRDYYIDHFDEDIYLNRYALDIIAPMYWNFDAPYAYDNGPAYVFSPQAEPYQDYMSANAAGSIDPNQNVGGMDFSNNQDGGGGVDFGDMGAGVGGIDFADNADFAAGQDIS